MLIGHSMGTQVALEAWHLFPKNVRGLVLICGSFGKVTQSFRGMPILDMILPKLMDIVDKQPEDEVRSAGDEELARARGAPASRPREKRQERREPERVGGGHRRRGRGAVTG